MLTALKSSRSWLAPPSSAAQWMAASAPLAACSTSSASADVALDQLDTDPGERGGLVRIADQGANVVAPLDQLLADVAAGLPGRTGDEDRAGHGVLLELLHIEHT